MCELENDGMLMRGEEGKRKGRGRRGGEVAGREGEGNGCERRGGEGVGGWDGREWRKAEEKKEGG